MSQTSVRINELKIDLKTAAREVVDKAGKDCVDALQSSSPEKGGDYAKGWKSDFLDDMTTIVYNDGNNKTLTHLLEKGHLIVHQGVTLGYSPPVPHIRPAFNQVKRKYLKDLKNIDLLKEMK